MITLSQAVEIATPNGPWLTRVGLFGDGPRAFMCGYPSGRPAKGNPLVRIQYGCAHGSIFQSLDCDCNAQIKASQEAIAKSQEAGLFVYFQDHEAYGLGIFEKMQIINMERRQNRHFNEIASDAHCLHLRNNVLWVVPHLLSQLGFGRAVKLMSDSVEKREALGRVGVEVVGMVSLNVPDAELSPEALRHRAGFGLAAERFSAVT
jgi:3,4-dihydroxy 2-butanone 4-phosphate synthase/GTP cyclohydrolase II